MALNPVDQFLLPYYSGILSSPHLFLILIAISALLSYLAIYFSKRYAYRDFLTLLVVFLLLSISVLISYYIYLYSTYSEIVSELPKNVIEGLTLFGFVGILLAFARDFVSEMNSSSELSSLNQKLDLILSNINTSNISGSVDRIGIVRTTLTGQNGDSKKKNESIDKWTFLNFLTISGLLIALVGSIGNLLYAGQSNPLDNYRFIYQVGLTVLIFGITWGIFHVQTVQSRTFSERLINIESRLTDLEELLTKPKEESIFKKIITVLFPCRK